MTAFFCICIALALAQDPTPIVSPSPDVAGVTSDDIKTALENAEAAYRKTLDELVAKRDPFKKPDLTPKKLPGMTDLQMFSALEFKMLGVMTGAGRTRAMLLAPNGRTYFVKEREKLGTQSGVIESITPTAVFVRERVSNLLGKEEMILTEIHLPSETGVSSVVAKETGATETEYAQTVESMKRMAPRGANPMTGTGKVDEKKALEEYKSLNPEPMTPKLEQGR